MVWCRVPVRVLVGISCKVDVNGPLQFKLLVNNWTRAVYFLWIESQSTGSRSMLLISPCLMLCIFPIVRLL